MSSLPAFVRRVGRGDSYDEILIDLQDRGDQSAAHVGACDAHAGADRRGHERWLADLDRGLPPERQGGACSSCQREDDRDRWTIHRVEGAGCRLRDSGSAVEAGSDRTHAEVSRSRGRGRMRTAASVHRRRRDADTRDRYARTTGGTDREVERVARPKDGPYDAVVRVFLDPPRAFISSARVD